MNVIKTLAMSTVPFAAAAAAVPANAATVVITVA